MRARTGPPQVRARLLQIACVFAVILAAVLPWDVRPAAACSCVMRTLEQEVADADAIFVGSVATVRPEASAGRSVAVFTLDHVYLGDPSARLSVGTALGSAACGVDFENGGRYLVFAYERGSGFETNLCTRTQPFEQHAVDDVAAITGPGREVASAESVLPSATTGGELAVALAVTAALVAGTLVLSRRR